MAIQSINVTSSTRQPIALGCCAEVILCLDESWATKTVSGLPYLVATLENTGRELSPGKMWRGPGRCVDAYQYSASVDDIQIAELDRVKYQLECDDVLEIVPYSCIIQLLFNTIQEGQALNQLCLQPLTEFPANPTQNCIVNIVGAGGGTPADGLYYFNGNDWVELALS